MGSLDFIYFKNCLLNSRHHPMIEVKKSTITYWNYFDKKQTSLPATPSPDSRYSLNP